MRKFIERIAFYIRYEMTEEVKARIELGVLCGAMQHRFHSTQGRIPFQPEEEPDWTNDASHLHPRPLRLKHILRGTAGECSVCSPVVPLLTLTHTEKPVI